LPHDEGNKMTVGRALPRMRARVAAVAIAGALASLTVAADAQAQAPARERRVEQAHPWHRRYLPPRREPLAHPGSAASAPNVQGVPIMRTASSPAEFGDHQRDGHMTVDERRLLRQHIEDAVRELYKR
jgi:hypothetical protein